MNSPRLNSPKRQTNRVNDNQLQRNQMSKSPKISANRSRGKQTIIDSKVYGLNAYKFIKHSPYNGSESLPPKAGPFQRTNRSRSRDTSIKDKSTSNVSNPTSQKQSDGNKQSRAHTQSVSKVTQLRKKISNEIAEKQKWKQMSQLNQEKLVKMSNELTKMKEHNKYLQDQIDKMIQLVSQRQKEVTESHQIVQQLNKTIKSQNAQLNVLKSKEAEIQQLKNHNKKIVFDNESLQKTINTLKTEIHKKNLSSLQEDNILKSQSIVKLQREIDRLRAQVKEKNEQLRLLQSSLLEVQKALYQKQSDLKKITINLSFMGRKTAMSIDDIRSRKDLQIKMMRDKYHKASKDLKELKDTKIKIQKKKSLSKDVARRVKSSKHLRYTSQSEQFTFQISSQA